MSKGTINMRKYKFGDRLAIGGQAVMITRAEDGDAFGTTPHYGFQWVDGNNWHQGWMPVILLETLATPLN